MSDSGGNGQGRDLGAFGYFAAIVLCCMIVGGLTYHLGREKERRYETPASYAQAAKSDAQSACIGREGTAAFECIYEKVEAAQEQARGEQDLSAQQNAANAALISALIAFATLILTAVGVWYVRGTLQATLKAVVDTGRATDAMERSNKIASRTALKADIQASEANRLAKDSAQRQIRAYIGVETVSAFFKTMNDLSFRVLIKNFGSTPARDVHYAAKTTTNKAETHGDLDWQYAAKQILSPTQTWTLPVQDAAKAGKFFTGERIMLLEIRYVDVFGNHWGLYQRFVSPDGQEWHSDTHGNFEKMMGVGGRPFRFLDLTSHSGSPAA